MVFLRGCLFVFLVSTIVISLFDGVFGATDRDKEVDEEEDTPSEFHAVNEIAEGLLRNAMSALHRSKGVLEELEALITDLESIGLPRFFSTFHGNFTHQDGRFETFYSKETINESMAFGAATPDECDVTGSEAAQSCCNHKRELETKEKQEVYENNMKTCFTKYFGDVEEPPADDVKMSLMECVGECFFNASGLLTPDMKLSMEKINTNGDMIDPDPKWKAIDEAAIKACFDKSVAEGNGSAKCKSGSFQLFRCVLRERFLNCPKDVWTENAECTKYKGVVQKCPNVIPSVA